MSINARNEGCSSSVGNCGWRYQDNHKERMFNMGEIGMAYPAPEPSMANTYGVDCTEASCYVSDSMTNDSVNNRWQRLGPSTTQCLKNASSRYNTIVD